MVKKVKKIKGKGKNFGKINKHNKLNVTNKAISEGKFKKNSF